jgi:hypothetical protein
LTFQEGSSYDRGLYARCFEELFDLANSDSTSTSQFNFSVTVFELYNEQVLHCSWHFLFQYILWEEAGRGWGF